MAILQKENQGVVWHHNDTSSTNLQTSIYSFGYIRPYIYASHVRPFATPVQSSLILSLISYNLPRQRQLTRVPVVCNRQTIFRI